MPANIEQSISDLITRLQASVGEGNMISAQNPLAQAIQSAALVAGSGLSGKNLVAPAIENDRLVANQDFKKQGALIDLQSKLQGIQDQRTVGNTLLQNAPDNIKAMLANVSPQVAAALVPKLEQTQYNRDEQARAAEEMRMKRERLAMSKQASTMEAKLGSMREKVLQSKLMNEKINSAAKPIYTALLAGQRKFSELTPEQKSLMTNSDFMPDLIKDMRAQAKEDRMANHELRSTVSSATKRLTTITKELSTVEEALRGKKGEWWISDNDDAIIADLETQKAALTNEKMTLLGVIKSAAPGLEKLYEQPGVKQFNKKTGKVDILTPEEIDQGSELGDSEITRELAVRETMAKMDDDYMSLFGSLGPQAFEAYNRGVAENWFIDKQMTPEEEAYARKFPTTYNMLKNLGYVNAEIVTGMGVVGLVKKGISFIRGSKYAMDLVKGVKNSKIVAPLIEAARKGARAWGILPDQAARVTESILGKRVGGFVSGATGKITSTIGKGVKGSASMYGAFPLSLGLDAAIKTVVYPDTFGKNADRAWKEFIGTVGMMTSSPEALAYLPAMVLTKKLSPLSGNLIMKEIGKTGPVIANNLASAARLIGTAGIASTAIAGTDELIRNVKGEPARTNMQNAFLAMITSPVIFNSMVDFMRLSRGQLLSQNPASKRAAQLQAIDEQVIKNASNIMKRVYNDPDKFGMKVVQKVNDYYINKRRSGGQFFSEIIPDAKSRKIVETMVKMKQYKDDPLMKYTIAKVNEVYNLDQSIITPKKLTTSGFSGGQGFVKPKDNSPNITVTKGIPVDISGKLRKDLPKFKKGIE